MKKLSVLCIAALRRPFDDRVCLPEAVAQARTIPPRRPSPSPAAPSAPTPQRPAPIRWARRSRQTRLEAARKRVP